MSRNGSGTYTLPAGNPVVTGTTISSTWANNTLTDIATALTGSLAADGQTTATGNLKMGANRITGLANGTLSTDATTVSQVDTAITTAGATYLLKASNLSDVANATTARGNLTAAKSGANSDITSLTGLTTALSAAQGGTGLTAPGTSGNVLTSNGSAWVSSTPTVGKVLQVLSAVTNTTTSNSSGTAVAATNLSVTITPSFSNSKIFIIASVPATASNGNGNYYIARNGSIISETEKFLSAGGTGTQFAISLSYLDSPATTSATTYQIYFNAGSNTLYVNQNGSYSTITVMEIAA